jgi:hypothetical protein
MAFPTTGLLDDFSGTLGGWTNPIFGASAVVISSGRLAGSAGGDNAACWTTNFASDDQEVYYEIPTDTGNLLSLYLLIQDTDSSPTCYAMDVMGSLASDVLRMRRFNNGALTTLKTGTLSAASGDWIGADKVGSLISVYHKPSAGSWTLIDSVTDGSPLTGGGKIGLDIEGTAMRVDNFGGGDVVAETPTRKIQFVRSTARIR